MNRPFSLLDCTFQIRIDRSLVLDARRRNRRVCRRGTDAIRGAANRHGEHGPAAERRRRHRLTGTCTWWESDSTLLMTRSAKLRPRARAALPAFMPGIIARGAYRLPCISLRAHGRVRERDRHATSRVSERAFGDPARCSAPKCHRPARRPHAPPRRHGADERRHPL